MYRNPPGRRSALSRMLVVLLSLGLPLATVAGWTASYCHPAPFDLTVNRTWRLDGRSLSPQDILSLPDQQRDRTRYEINLIRVCNERGRIEADRINRTHSSQIKPPGSLNTPPERVTES